MDYKETDFSFLYDDLTKEYGNEQGKQFYILMCEKYCCLELCMVFCQSDVTAFSGYEPKIRFERRGTIGGGADCCDFHFIHGNQKHIIEYNRQRTRHTDTESMNL